MTSEEFIKWRSIVDHEIHPETGTEARYKLSSILELSSKTVSQWRTPGGLPIGEVVVAGAFTRLWRE